MFSSILFPVGMMADIVTGGIVVGLLSGVIPVSVAAENISFVTTFTMTIVYGLAMNLLLWGLIGVLYWLFRFFPQREPPRGICLKCGYDLRASPLRCPECGARNPMAHPSSPLAV
jgi:hypothetical protein